ncbi:unnamed protein product [Adineta steineri]|uniref:Hexosyltransferase n=2 Tax=Adineta steineri TaxID=433720 RepID=A0A814ADP6_9BILA|nr:unnamed protein product [Adineta steineri]
MNVSIPRCRRRYLCIISSVFFSLILFIYIQYFQYLSDNENLNQPAYCNQTIIRKHFMQNKSPQELFEEYPSQSTFTYEIHNGNFCLSLRPHALVFVISKSNNFESRNAIRRTWGNFAHISSLNKFSHLRLKLLFLIDIDESRLLSIELEQRLYHDIVQVRLPQYYSLSTYRDMAILHWTDKYCSEAMTTVKTDDDIFLNTYLLANIINTIRINTTIDKTKLQCNYSDTSAIIHGNLFKQAPVVRYSSDSIQEGTRYITTNTEYPCNYYPDYMSGFGYIVNRNARSKLLCTFFRDKLPFHMSDVYVTGIIPEYVDIKRQDLNLLISYRSDDDCEKFFKERNPNSYACASSLHYNQKQMNIFELAYLSILFCIHHIWCTNKHICDNQFLCPHRQITLYTNLRIIQENQQSLCSIRSKKRGSHQYVIGVSAYLSRKDNKKLISKLKTYLLQYIQEAKENYPKWIVRVYYFSLNISREEILDIEDKYDNVDFCDVTNLPVLGNVLTWLPGNMQRKIIDLTKPQCNYSYTSAVIYGN